MTLTERSLRVDAGTPRTPKLIGFSPGQAAAGEVVVVFGADLDRDGNGDLWQGSPPWEVVFSASAAVPPSTGEATVTFVSPNELLVTVPAPSVTLPGLSATAPLSLVEDGTILSTTIDSFVINPPPPPPRFRITNHTQYSIISLRQDGTELVVDPADVIPIGGSADLPTPAVPFVQLEIGLGVSFGDTPLVTQSSDVGALFPGANPIALGPIEIGDLLADFDANRAQAHAWVLNPFPGPDGRVHVETISFLSDGSWASFVDAGQAARSGSVSLVSWPDNALTVQFSLADDLPIATLLPPFTHFVLDGRLFTASERTSGMLALVGFGLVLRPTLRSRLFITGLATLVVGCSPPERQMAAKPAGWIIHQAANPNPNPAYKWLEVALEATARDVERIGARPPIISREVSIYVTAMYDAWAAYDDRAVGTRLGGKLRRPRAERTAMNKETAIAYAVHRALEYLYPADAKWLAEQMRAAGHDPADDTTDVTKPQGVGNVAAAALIAYHRHDGANQDGDEVGSSGERYSDYTYYQPRNPTDRIVDPDRWQQIPFDDGKGGKIYPGFLAPHWYRVQPFALERSDQFRPGPYPKVGTEELKKEVDECIAFNGNLTLEQKAIVEFMRDGPRSTGQSGHWLRFAQDVSRRDNDDLDRDVKLFFSVGNVTFDAFVACWEAKRYYDSSRPWTLIRHLYGEKRIVGYRGPCKGFATIRANTWHPYSPSTFVTPPFPGYPSGHSTASGAASKMLELFTGSDRYGAVARRRAGELTEPTCGVAQMEARDGVAATDVPDGPEVELELPTFSATAEMAGISRVMGGYHMRADNVAGLELGRRIAQYSWPKYQAYFNGTAPAGRN